jgi:hypothetical protein
MDDKLGIFDVGRRYENRRGPYTVIEITPPHMRIRYDSGEVISADLQTQARIIENMGHSVVPPDARVTKSDYSHNTEQRQRRDSRSGGNAPSSRAPSETRRTKVAYSTVELSPGRLYRRRDLHAMYRGQEQGGICTPKDSPIIPLFSGQGGDLYGYKDYWDDDDTFHYFGEGQVGDMEFIRGNRAIRDHVASGKELHLFEAIGNGDVRYINQMTCIGYDYVSDVPDSAGQRRIAIVFKLKSR